MKKYTYPSMNIALFNKEEVATTASAADMTALQTWAESQTNGNSTDSRMVDFTKAVTFAF